MKSISRHTRRPSLLIAVGAWLSCASIAPGAVVIDFSGASINVSGNTVDVTGMTTGDVSAPYRVRLVVSGGGGSQTQSISVNNTTGGVGTNLRMQLDDSFFSGYRSSTSQISATITWGTNNDRTIINPEWTFLDVDAWDDSGFFDSSTYDFDNFQDEIDILTGSATFTPETAGYHTITGNNLLATFDDNVDPSDDAANVDVSINGSSSSIGFNYGPGSEDGFETVQFIGISNITFEAVPEPASILLGGLAAGGAGIAALMRRRRRSATMETMETMEGSDA